MLNYFTYHYYSNSLQVGVLEEGIGGGCIRGEGRDHVKGRIGLRVGITVVGGGCRGGGLQWVEGRRQLGDIGCGSRI
jgi:hypothetical protein